MVGELETPGVGWGARERPTGRTVLLRLVNAAISRGPRLQLDRRRTEHQVTCSLAHLASISLEEGQGPRGPDPRALDAVRDACHVCDELREAGLKTATSWGHRPGSAGIPRVAQTVGNPTKQRNLEARARWRAPFPLDVLGWSLGLVVGCAQAPAFRGSHQLMFCFPWMRWKDRLEAGGLCSLHLSLSGDSCQQGARLCAVQACPPGPEGPAWSFPLLVRTAALPRAELSVWGVYMELFISPCCQISLVRLKLEVTWKSSVGPGCTRAPLRVPAPGGLLAPSDLGCLTWEKKSALLHYERSGRLPRGPRSCGIQEG